MMQLAALAALSQSINTDLLTQDHLCKAVAAMVQWLVCSIHVSQSVSG